MNRAQDDGLIEALRVLRRGGRRAGGRSHERELGEKRRRLLVLHGEFRELAHVLHAGGGVVKGVFDVFLVEAIQHEVDHLRRREERSLPAPGQLEHEPSERLEAAARAAGDKPPGLGAQKRNGVGLRPRRLPYPVRRLLPHPGEQLQRALPGQFVRRGGDQPQKRRDVLDVALLEEAQPASDLEGNSPARELHLKLHGVEMRPVEHGDLGERRPRLVAQGEGAIRHEVGLLHHVARGHQGGLHPLAAGGLEPLLELAPVAGDGGVRQREDGGGAPVVLLQAKESGVGVALGKGDDVLEARPPEAVDALGVVPHDGEVPPSSGQIVHHVGLNLVGVLVFVHENVAEARLQLAPRLLVAGEQIPREGEQAGEIDRLNLFFALLVAGGDLLYLAQAVGQVGIAAQNHLGDALVGIRRQGENRLQNPAPGKILLLRVEPREANAVRHEVGGVLAIQDGEVRPVADELPVAPEDQVPHVVEGAAPHAARVRLDERRRAMQHLARRLVREGDEEDGFGRHALLDEARQAVGDGVRLAAARPRDDEERTLARHHHLQLAGVQLLLIRRKAGARARAAPEGVGSVLSGGHISCSRGDLYTG